MAVVAQPSVSGVAVSNSKASLPADCFHCGQPVPARLKLDVVVDGERRPMCCQGCAAVARAIVEAGLTDFYRHRTEPSRRVEDLVPAELGELALFDRPDLQRNFVRAQGEHVREASLILEGVVCAACVWLNERHVSALPGVLEFRVNYTTHRAQLRWDSARIRLSEILAAIAAIGYQAHPFDPGRQETVQKRERALALRRIAVAGLGTMQVMMLAVAMYYGDHYGMDADIRVLLRWVSLIVSIPVIAYAARPFFSAAWRGLRRRQLSMDLPVSLAIGGAFAASAWYTWQGGGEVYFDSVTMFTFFLLTGRFLEMNARHRAGRVSEELVRLLPATATRLDRDGLENTVAVAQLVPGDRVRVRPGETVPADGRVEGGESSVDESLMSGESVPRTRGIGDALIGGSVNVDGPLVMCVERVGGDTVVSSIVRLLDRAQSERPRIAQAADRVAGWFVGGVLIVASGVAWWWWQHDSGEVLRVTLSVLVVTCPCALSLATPAAITAATGRLTRLGVLTTRGQALETLARATHVVFDKTGTLTYGRLRLVALEPLRGLAAKDCLELAAALECGSEHPIGRALSAEAGGACSAEEVRNFPGRGVEGRVHGTRYRLGKPDFVAAGSGRFAMPDQEDESAAVWVLLADERGPLARFGFADALRPDAAATIADLRRMGLKVMLLSGDRPSTVDQIARALSIESAEGGLLPDDKLSRIRALQSQGAVVAMVGDGINDAPVLAGAQVSLAMGSGTQLAHAAADMVLLSEAFHNIAQAVQLARRTLAIIRQNLAWAATYNAVALPLAVAGWVAPWMAALGMSVSSLLVVVNALRLTTPTRPREPVAEISDATRTL